MFFFNRKPLHSDFSSVGIDMHSHLIPGVDDGAQDIQSSLAMINGLMKLGYRHLITTPHTLADYHPNTARSLREGYLKLDGTLPTGITLSLSSEYFLDAEFIDQLTAGTVLPFFGNRLLIEFSQVARPMDLEEVIFDIRVKGYNPVLAHPERYLFFHRNFDYYKRIKELGVEFQVNAMSLTSHYGREINQVAEKLIEKDMIDFIGTDIHHSRHLEVLKRVPGKKHFARLIDSGILKNQSLG